MAAEQHAAASVSVEDRLGHPKSWETRSLDSSESILGRCAGRGLQPLARAWR